MPTGGVGTGRCDQHRPRPCVRESFGHDKGHEEPLTHPLTNQLRLRSRRPPQVTSRRRRKWVNPSSELVPRSHRTFRPGRGIVAEYVEKQMLAHHFPHCHSRRCRRVVSKLAGVINTAHGLVSGGCFGHDKVHFTHEAKSPWDRSTSSNSRWWKRWSRCKFDTAHYAWGRNGVCMWLQDGCRVYMDA